MLLPSHWPSFSPLLNPSPPSTPPSSSSSKPTHTYTHTLPPSLARNTHHHHLSFWEEKKRRGIPTKPTNFKQSDRIMNMMVQPMNPYSASCQSKEAEIMSRYRPIAPKPAPTAMSTAAVVENPPLTTTEATSPIMQQAVHLRPLWPGLNQRPTRSRKRGRAASSSLSPSPPTFKRAARATHHPVLPLLRHTHPPPPDHLFPMHFSQCHRLPQFPISPPSLTALGAVSGGFELEMTSPTGLPSPSSTLSCITEEENKVVMDLNQATMHEVPEEKDLLCQLQDSKADAAVVIITPRPLRPVGSSISIHRISEEPGYLPEVVKRKEEVEEELEAEATPAVVSDSNNKVRLANSAYREMVGQPECPWLGLGGGGGGGGACRRIGGEVMLHLPKGELLLMLERFSCWVKIEWLCNGKKSSVNALCNANRLSCESNDYAFAWRFHTRGTDDCESSN